jgi:hypothetical protein
MPRHDWGTYVDIQAPSGATDEISAWHDLKFNPVGLYDLRRRLGALKSQKGVFMRYQHRFLCSDLAWFVAGAHTDGNHTVGLNEFHPLFRDARLLTNTAQERRDFRDKVQSLIFDLVSIVFSYISIMHVLICARPRCGIAHSVEAP